jgi:perosamine synthetase
MQKFEILEQKYAEHLGVESTVAVNTGTAALHVALEALKLPEGSKVIVPEFTMYASGLAVHYARLTPVFVDCDDRLLIDLDKVEEAIDEDTKVLMVTHVYGRVVDMSRVMKIAEKYNLRVIEDACEAQGAYWDGKAVGSFDIGCFSLYRNKIICAEEGGIVASNDTELLKVVRDMKSMSFGEEHNYYHKQIGFNYRMTNSQASLAIDSLFNYQSNHNKRRVNEEIYNTLLPGDVKMSDRDAVWVYDFISPLKDKIVSTLNSCGFAARHSFKPMSMMPLFKKDIDYKKLLSFEKSQNVGYLPVDPYLEEKDILEICSITNKILKEK